MSPAIERIRAYHQATKHAFDAYAKGPGHLDWASQPNPFRRWEGAPTVPLLHIPPDPDLPYALPFEEGRIPPEPFGKALVSRLFYDSLALSAWKRAGNTRWALRVNPSSGNLHPTEGYLLSGPIPGLLESAAICHYAPREHALEIRHRLSDAAWRQLSAGLPEGAFWVGLASIHWREAWKYGERAFRYCQHDVGHALAAIALAAAGMGWKAQIMDTIGDEELAALLGLSPHPPAEPETPDCLIAVYPQGHTVIPALSTEAIQAAQAGPWFGTPNRLSTSHVDWPAIRDAEVATVKPRTPAASAPGETAPWPPCPVPPTPEAEFRRMIHQRRSAVDMDGHTGIPAPAFYRILEKLMPRPGRFPFNSLPWAPTVHLALFVHRVPGLAPGIYLLARAPDRTDFLKRSLNPEFHWDTPPGVPAELPLFLLAKGNVTTIAMHLSCHQNIAGHGAFSLGMVTEFDRALTAHGAWFYRRLFWEAGAIGQVLYLEAEAHGLRGTGIGCFFDDPVHRLFGIQDTALQSLYHFTVGGAVEDARLETLSAYPEVAG